MSAPISRGVAETNVTESFLAEEEVIYNGRKWSCCEQDRLWPNTSAFLYVKLFLSLANVGLGGWGTWKAIATHEDLGIPLTALGVGVFFAVYASYRLVNNR